MATQRGKNAPQIEDRMEDQPKEDPPVDDQAVQGPAPDEVRIVVLKETHIGGQPVDVGEELTVKRRDVSKLLKHRMVQEA